MYILFIIWAFFVGALAAMLGYPVRTHPIEFFLIVIPLDAIGYIAYLYFSED